MPTALITGITGQDGSYLAEFLIEKGYEVHGIIRRSSSFNTGRIEHLYLEGWIRDQHVARRIHLHYGDMTDSSSLIRIIRETRPDEIYNLAAQSHVKVSFDVPEYTAETDAVGTLRLLEAVRILGMEKKCRIYQASTSELFGKVEEVPQCETTPFHPRSPYAVAKLYSFWIMKNYRESYGMFTANGGARTSSPAKSPSPPPASPPDSRTVSISAISTPSATGAMPPTMSSVCG